jgi:hypothetical protein
MIAVGVKGLWVRDYDGIPKNRRELMKVSAASCSLSLPK